MVLTQNTILGLLTLLVTMQHETFGEQTMEVLGVLTQVQQVSGIG
jgi:hypothetical protein